MALSGNLRTENSTRKLTGTLPGILQFGVPGYTPVRGVDYWTEEDKAEILSQVQPLAQELGISVIELMNGEHITNKNTSANMLRCKFYVCPVCGNIIHSSGSAVISCCGITLPPLEAEEADEDHTINIETVEDEHFITVHHPMTKEHFISFIAFVTSDRMQLVKLYPEGNAETRLQLRGMGYLYWYCNRHGLFKKRAR